MPRSSDDERDKLGKAARKYNRLRGDLRAWVATPPANNAQRDRMLADLAAATLALGQQINLLRGDVDPTDLEDPGV